jgi:hypothetical protein
MLLFARCPVKRESFGSAFSRNRGIAVDNRDALSKNCRDDFPLVVGRRRDYFPFL